MLKVCDANQRRFLDDAGFSALPSYSDVRNKAVEILQAVAGSSISAKSHPASQRDTASISENQPHRYINDSEPRSQPSSRAGSSEANQPFNFRVPPIRLHHLHEESKLLPTYAIQSRLSMETIFPFSEGSNPRQADNTLMDSFRLLQLICNQPESQGDPIHWELQDKNTSFLDVALSWLNSKASVLDGVEIDEDNILGSFKDIDMAPRARGRHCHCSDRRGGQSSPTTSSSGYFSHGGDDSSDDENTPFCVKGCRVACSPCPNPTMYNFVLCSSWAEVLHGVKSGQLQNCFLSGTDADKKCKTAFIDSEMQRFAEIRWFVNNGRMFLYWLGYTRQVDIYPDTSILHSFGPLYFIPSSRPKLASYTLGSVWSIGFIHDLAIRMTNSIPTARHYAMEYMGRGISLRSDSTRSRDFGKISAGKIIRNEMNRGSYRMRVGKIRLCMTVVPYHSQLSVLTFQKDGLTLQKLDRTVRKSVSGSLSTSPSATCALEDEDIAFYDHRHYKCPISELEKQFLTPKVRDVLLQGSLSPHDLAIAHTIAAVCAQTDGPVLSGAALCPLRTQETTNLTITGPLSVKVLAASGWTFGMTRIRDLYMRPLDLEDLAITKDLRQELSMEDIDSEAMIVCRKHLGDEAYWGYVRRMQHVVEIDDETERERKERKAWLEYVSQSSSHRSPACEKDEGEGSSGALELKSEQTDVSSLLCSSNGW